MKRGLLVSAMVAAIVVAMAPAALAKGTGEAELTGPALSKPIVFKGRPSSTTMGQFWEFVSNAGLFEETKNPSRPNVALGPRYRITVWISADPDHPMAPVDRATADRFIAELYPYAVGGPWLYVPDGQQGTEFGVIEGGWWAPAFYFLDQLHTKGLPEKSPVPFSTDPPKDTNTNSSGLGPVGGKASGPPPPGSSSLGRLWIALGVGLTLALMSLAGYALSRPRRGRIPA